MNGFEELIENLLSETEKAIMNLSNIEGSESSQALLREVQNAIKSNDINKLNQIIQENGDKINK